MATSDDRGFLKIWDLRTYRELHSFKLNAMISNLSFSQKKLLAMSVGRTTLIMDMKPSFKPCDRSGTQEMSKFMQHLYLKHPTPRKQVTSLKFCPYEDVLGIGLSTGFSSIVAPGAGEPNYDLFEADPFETRKQRNDKIVYQLLDKLQPEMIQLNPDFIASTPGMVRVENQNRRREADMKWARKNVTKNVRNGYKGVIRKRYSKYRHMKDLHIRQQKMIQILNMRKKINSKERKEESMARKDKIAKYLKGEREKVKSALDRFIDDEPKRTNHMQFKSKWRRKPTKIHF